jgi:hypothetical protein
MKKIFAILISALMFSAAPAFAQNAAALDPATVAATKDLVEAMNVRQTMRASVEAVLAAMPQQMQARLNKMISDDPRMTPEQKQKALAQLEQRIPKMVASVRETLTDPILMDEMADAMIPLYAKTYTTDEIHQLAAFYRSPVGQKMLASTPKVMVETMEISNRIMMPRLQKKIAETTEEFTKGAL